MKQSAHIAEKRQALLAEYPQIAAETAATRGQTVSQLAELIRQAQASLADKGTQVYLAKDAAEAQAIISRLCADAHKLCRTNSAELTEIGFDQLMNEAQKPLVITSLPEIIAQEAGLPQAYTHCRLQNLDELSEEEIIAALQKYVGSEDITEPAALASLTKQVIRSEIIASDFGVTGLDACIAENGTIVLAENEGNGRMVSNLPYRHLAVAGLEKLYDTAEHAMYAIQAANIYGLGQRNATYYSYISGQSRTADIEFRMVYGMHGPLEVHLILLDNGRSELIERGCGNVLKCIDCGACYESLSKLAEPNGWQARPLSAKNVALLAVRRQLGSCAGLEALEPFDCPAGITAEDVLTAVRQTQE